MASYSETDKLTAIEIVERFGGEITQECLNTIRAALAAPKLNKTTVYRWLDARSRLQPVATELQPIKKAAGDAVARTLDEHFEEVARRMLLQVLDEEENVIGQMKGQQLVTAAAIAVDKMRLLRDMPTEIIQIWPGFMTALDELGLNAADVFNAVIAQARAEKARRDGDV